MVKGYFIVLLWNQVWVVTARRRTHKPINARCHTGYTVPATGHRCCSLWLGPFPCSSWKRCGNVSSAKSILCGFSFSLTLCDELTYSMLLFDWWNQGLMMYSAEGRLLGRWWWLGLCFLSRLSGGIPWSIQRVQELRQIIKGWRRNGKSLRIH